MPGSMSAHQMNKFKLYYHCERKQHEENFQQLDSSFWCFAAFSSKLPDTSSLSADWTRLKTVGNWADVCWCEERRMWHRLEAKASLLGKWRLLRACSINRDKVWCNPVEKLVVRCLTFFAGVLWKQTCMSSNFADFYVRSTALRNFPEPSSNREMLVFRTKWLAIFFPQACRLAFFAALGHS